jgi:hypothetical protein
VKRRARPAPPLLALSLALATALADLEPPNDNGSLSRSRPSPTPRLAVARQREEVARLDAERAGEPAEQRDRQVHPALDALDRRDIDAHVLGKLRLAPLPADPKLARSETDFTT